MVNLVNFLNTLANSANGYANSTNLINIKKENALSTVEEQKNEKIEKIYLQHLSAQSWHQNFSQVEVFGKDFVIEESVKKKTTKKPKPTKPTKPTTKPTKPTKPTTKPTKPTKPTTKPTKPTTVTVKPTTKLPKPTKMPSKPDDATIKDYDKNKYNKRGGKVVEVIKKTWKVIDKTLDKTEQVLNIIQSLDSMFGLGIYQDTEAMKEKILNELKDYINKNPDKSDDDNVNDYSKQKLTEKVKEVLLEHFKEDKEIVENKDVVDYLTNLTTQKLWDKNEKTPSEEVILATINEVFDDPNTWGESFWKLLSANKFSKKEINDMDNLENQFENKVNFPQM